MIKGEVQERGDTLGSGLVLSYFKIASFIVLLTRREGSSRRWLFKVAEE